MPKINTYNLYAAIIWLFAWIAGVATTLDRVRVIDAIGLIVIIFVSMLIGALTTIQWNK